MTLTRLMKRAPTPQPWAEGCKIPWNEPGFSKRMLNEHLSQAHDLASRRMPTIIRQVEWIHARLFHAEPQRILDLGCGPGLYAEPFVKRGHEYVGIDFSPASIAHARNNAGEGASFMEGDVRTADFIRGRTAVMFLYGEINVFTRADAELILARAAATLEPGGILVLEAHTFDCVKRIGMEPPSWNTAEKGLFSDAPYLFLSENHWSAQAAAAVNRFYVIEEGSEDVAFYTQSIQAYTEEQYTSLVEGAGFTATAFHPSLSGDATGDGNLCVITARKAEARGREGVRGARA